MPCSPLKEEFKVALTSISVIFLMKNAQVLNIYHIIQLCMIPISPEWKTKWQFNKLQFASPLNTEWYHHFANHFLHFGFNLSVTKNYLKYINKDIGDDSYRTESEIQKWLFKDIKEEAFFTQYFLKDNFCQHS